MTDEMMNRFDDNTIIEDDIDGFQVKWIILKHYRCIGKSLDMMLLEFREDLENSILK